MFRGEIRAYKRKIETLVDDYSTSANIVNDVLDKQVLMKVKNTGVQALIQIDVKSRQKRLASASS